MNEGVHRIVMGDYARNHPWAIMVGLERVGPICMSIQKVEARLVGKYGNNHGFKPNPSVKLSNVRESEHYQAGGSHKITIVPFLLLNQTSAIIGHLAEFLKRLKADWANEDRLPDLSVAED